MERCPKCGVRKDESEFLSLEGGRACRDCACRDLDVRDREAVADVVRQLGRPLLWPMWAETVNKAMRSGGGSARSAVGRYLRLLNMAQFKGCGSEEELAEVWGRTHDMEADVDPPPPEPEPEPEAEGEAEEGPALNGNDLELYRSLSADDVRYLTGKWGSEYLPSEWVQMESMYAKYAEEYELSVDRAQTLVFMCKTTVRMNQMLAQGNVADYQRLAGVLKDLRASGRFTEAQKVEKKRYLDSVGELVAFCEREGGIVPQCPDPDEFPQDKVDFTIRDLKAYTYNLVANEMGLGSVIEAYVKKLEEAEGDVSLDASRLVTSGEEADEEYMNDVTAEEWESYLESGIDDEIDGMLRQVRS